MREHYSVSKCGKRDLAPAPPYRGVRTYYIAAEEVEWDYAPDRSWERERHSHSTERYSPSFGDALGKDFSVDLGKVSQGNLATCDMVHMLLLGADGAAALNLCSCSRSLGKLSAGKTPTRG